MGCLHLIDFDREGITNLNRQRYFARRLGQLKTDVMKETITGIASYCETVTDPARITEDDLAEFLAKEGFAAMPYMYPDLDTARDLANAGTLPMIASAFRQAIEAGRKAYMPGMEQIQSDIMDKVMGQVNAYDPSLYTAKDGWAFFTKMLPAAKKRLHRT